jgi:hypothetical protein
VLTLYHSQSPFAWQLEGSLHHSNLMAQQNPSRGSDSPISEASFRFTSSSHVVPSWNPGETSLSSSLDEFRQFDLPMGNYVGTGQPLHEPYWTLKTLTATIQKRLERNQNPTLPGFSPQSCTEFYGTCHNNIAKKLYFS